jgi:hypothetical protein
MAVVSIHGRSAQDRREFTQWSTWFFGRLDPASPKFWLTGIAFLALYLAFNKLTERHEFDGLGITLWSPDNGLSLALLTEGALFAPFVFLGAVLTDAFIAGVHHSLYVTVAAELVLTIGYVGLAAVLRHKLKFNPKQVRLANVVVLLIFVPAGTTLTSLSYCGVLYLGDSQVVLLAQIWPVSSLPVGHIFLGTAARWRWRQRDRRNHSPGLCIQRKRARRRQLPLSSQPLILARAFRRAHFVGVAKKV